MVEGLIESKEREQRQRYEQKAQKLAQEKTEKEKEAQRKKDLEQLAKAVDNNDHDAKMTYAQYLIGETSENKQEALLSALVADDEKVKAKEEEENKKRSAIRKILVDNGAQNRAWLNKTSYT